MRRELQLAQEIQNALLPKEVPELEGFEIDAAYRAALEVGGDYYDFFEVDKSSIGIVVADVSGKGIGSSMVMTMIRTSMRLEARGNKRASDVLYKVHKVAVGDIKKGMYVTMFYVILDAKKRMVNYASAGHNPMILYRDETKSISFLNPSGIAVGIDLGDPEEFKKRITSEKLKLKKGKIKVKLDTQLTEELEAEGYAREISRKIQAERKKEGLDEELEQRLGSKGEMKKLKIILKNYFADKRAIIYGCSSIFKDFYLELVSREIYLNNHLTPLRYLEFYTYYLNFRDFPFGNQLLEMIERVKVNRKAELKALLLGFEELSYPSKIVSELIIKEWKRLRLWE